MKFTLITAVVALAVGVVKSAPPKTFMGFPLSVWKKYHCLTLERYLDTIAEPCARNCLELILDGTP